MITMEQALNVVRNERNGDYILKAFEYKDEYIFEVLSKDYKKMYSDPAMFWVMNKTSGSLKCVSPFSYGEAWGSEAYKNAKTIDKVSFD